MAEEEEEEEEAKKGEFKWCYHARTHMSKGTIKGPFKANVVYEEVSQRDRARKRRGRVCLLFKHTPLLLFLHFRQI